LPSEIEETILAYGHQNILGTHPTTLEITEAKDVTKKGDCIIAVSADKAVGDLDAEFKQKLRTEGAELTILIQAGEVIEMLTASGSPHLILANCSDMVVRRSSFVCSRTLAVQADKSACDLSRRLLELLKSPRQEVRITLTVRV
jgi:hypothetical protein